MEASEDISGKNYLGEGRLAGNLLSYLINIIEYYLANFSGDGRNVRNWYRKNQVRHIE